MITYLEAKEIAKKDGFTIELKEFLFSLFVAEGKSYEDAYDWAIRKDQIKTYTKQNRLSSRTNGKKLSGKGQIKYLIMLLRPHHIEYVKKFAIENIDEFGFVPKNQKQQLVDESLVKKYIEKKESLGAKINPDFESDLLKSIKDGIYLIINGDLDLSDKASAETFLKATQVALQRLLPQPKEEGQNDFDKTFIEIYSKFGGVCPICQRETELQKGIICKCVRCGAELDCRED